MKRGFTLIELLVVIAIIALLSSIVLASVSTSRARANDAKRVSDLREVQKALEFYATSNAGSYPTTSGNWRSECNGDSLANIAPGLTPTYMSTFPRDPQQKNTGSLGTSNCCYAYQSDGKDYALIDFKCTSSDITRYPTLINPTSASPVYPSWSIYTPGAVSNGWL